MYNQTFTYKDFEKQLEDNSRAPFFHDRVSGGTGFKNWLPWYFAQIYSMMSQ